MKRSLATRKILTIREKLISLSGLISTPYCDYECYRVKRCWVFGSYVKGSENPNDIDILIEGYEVGRNQTISSRAKALKKHGNAKVKKSTINRSVQLPVRCRDEAIKTIRENNRNISFHFYHIEKGFGDIEETKVLIYPRIDLYGAGIDSKQCTVCKKVKLHKYFSADKTRVDGLRHRCKECENYKTADRHSKNKQSFNFKEKHRDDFKKTGKYFKSVIIRDKKSRDNAFNKLQRFTDKEDELIIKKEKNGKYLTDIEIGKVLGRSVKSVETRRYVLKKRSPKIQADQ